LIKKFFIPAIWAEILVQLQDMTALSAAFYVDCNVNKFFNQMIHLASEEGMTEISGRVAGAYFFEIKAAQEAWNEPEKFSSKEKGLRYGRALATITNYTL